MELNLKVGDWLKPEFRRAALGTHRSDYAFGSAVYGRTASEADRSFAGSTAAAHERIDLEAYSALIILKFFQVLYERPYKYRGLTHLFFQRNDNYFYT